LLRMSSRTLATSTTSSILIPRASSKLRDAVLSHSAVKAGTIQSSTAYVRARRSRSDAVGGLIDLNVNLRSEEKPQRVDRWRIDLHCSYERSCSSKFLADVCTSINRKQEKVLRTHSGYKTERKASKSLHSTSPRDTIVDEAS